MNIVLLCQVAIQLATSTRGNLFQSLSLQCVIIVQLKLFQLVSYLFSSSDDVVSVNGSSITEQYSSVTKSGGTLNCTDPASSVLFDGHIPTLTGLDGDMDKSASSSIVQLRKVLIVTGWSKV